MYLYTKSIAMTLCSVTAALAVALTGLAEEASIPDASSMPCPVSQSQAASIPDSPVSAGPGSDTMQQEENTSVSSPDMEDGGANVPDVPTGAGETEEPPANAAEIPVDTGAKEEDTHRAALLSLDTPPVITGELAMLLATNQADSIMGSLGLARSDECRTVRAVLRLEDFNGKDTLDENYAALWAALEAELSALPAQGVESAGCGYADGAITIWA